MPDLDLPWKGDLSLTPAGDLSLAVGKRMGDQRIIRRLLTAVNGYVWNLSYGAGLPQRIGKPAQSRAIRALVRANLRLESTVAAIPVPQVTVSESTETQGLFVIVVRYWTAAGGTPIDLRLEVPAAS